VESQVLPNDKCGPDSRSMATYPMSEFFMVFENESRRISLHQIKDFLLFGKVDILCLYIDKATDSFH